MTQDIYHDPPPRAVLPTRHYFTPRPLRAENDRASNEPAARPQEILPVRLTRISVRGCTLKFETGAGVFSKSGLDAGSRLLIETVELAADARVCDLGCGWGAVGCFAAALRAGARVWMCDINLHAVLLAKRNLHHNNYNRVTTWCGDGLSAVGAASFDAVLCNPPVRAGNAVIARLFEDAHRTLRPGGALWVVLRTAQGAKSWQRRLTQLFGNCATVAIDGGYRILKSVKEI